MEDKAKNYTIDISSATITRILVTVAILDQREVQQNSLALENA